MTAPQKQKLAKQVVLQARERDINFALFRNMIGKQLGLHMTDFEALDLLFYRQVSSPSELARYTGLSTGATTVMIDRLENSGLVKRQPNPDDRRGTLIVLNKPAIQRIAPLFSSLRQAQTQLLSGYSEDQLLLIANYLQTSAAMLEVERQKLLKS